MIKEKVENLTESEATNKLLEFVNDVSNHSICTTGLLYGYLISEISNPPVSLWRNKKNWQNKIAF